MIRASRIALSLVCAMSLGGCFEPADDPGSPEQIPIDDLSAALSALQNAFNERDLDAYAALLDEEFQFCPLRRDSEDFPWAPGECWDRAAELVLLANLPHPILGNELNVTELSRRDSSEHEVELTCVMQAWVLMDDGSGWSYDRRLLFDFVNRDGVWKVLRITEVDL